MIWPPGTFWCRRPIFVRSVWGLDDTRFGSVLYFLLQVADFGFSRDVMANNIYERKSEGRLPIRWMAPEALYDNVYTT